jgi:ribosome biogenesis protein ENP2
MVNTLGRTHTNIRCPRLGLNHLIGTPALKPYMHGYFMALKLYDAARVITNPTSYSAAREKVVQDKLAKLADSRIRARKDGGVKVNKALADRIVRVEEREARKKKGKDKAKISKVEGMDGDNPQDEEEDTVAEKAPKRKTILNDDRFKDLFENADFQIDESSREFALLNPAAVGPGPAASSSTVCVVRKFGTF